MSLRIGIDLGTTNSYVAVGEETASGELIIDVLEIPQEVRDGGDIEAQRSLPSVILLPSTPDGHPSVGQRAYRSNKGQDHGRVSLIKNHMGTDWGLPFLGERWTPEKISSHFIRHLVQTVRDDRFVEDIDVR